MIHPQEAYILHHDIVANYLVITRYISFVSDIGCHHEYVGGPEVLAWIINRLQRIKASLALFLGGNCRIGGEHLAGSVQTLVEGLCAAGRL